ncbi:hypothetical protein FVE85_9181 [Porphyridium purpureum]|uniref:OB domain-containing protein n=1 Tax=Porphyridium purpureum TaxID=35688 RepID=A0A5J4YN83_PORPP|nr:hypothetical protein FVE85_9181 [Porphyridium purpureum]|eukprot:POR4700..scf222_8
MDSVSNVTQSSGGKPSDREGSRKTFVSLIARQPARVPPLVWVQGVLVWCGARAITQRVLLDDGTGVIEVLLDTARFRELSGELCVGMYLMVVGSVESFPTGSPSPRVQLSARTVRDLSTSVESQAVWILEVIAVSRES